MPGMISSELPGSLLCEACVDLLWTKLHVVAAHSGRKPHCNPHSAVVIAICCRDVYNHSAPAVKVRHIRTCRKLLCQPFSTRRASEPAAIEEMSLVKAILPIRTLQGSCLHVCHTPGGRQAAYVTALSLRMHM